MNKYSMRDVTIYYAHDLLGFTAPELSKIYGIGAPYIRRIVSKVREVESGKYPHGPTQSALKYLQRSYPVHTLRGIRALWNFAQKLDKEINDFMSKLIAYAPEIQDTDLLDGFFCVSDNLEAWRNELGVEIEKFMRYRRNEVDDEMKNFLHKSLAD